MSSPLNMSTQNYKLPESRKYENATTVLLFLDFFADLTKSLIIKYLTILLPFEFHKPIPKYPAHYNMK